MPKNAPHIGQLPDPNETFDAAKVQPRTIDATPEDFEETLGAAGIDHRERQEIRQIALRAESRLARMRYYFGEGSFGDLERRLGESPGDRETVVRQLAKEVVGKVFQDLDSPDYLGSPDYTGVLIDLDLPLDREGLSSQLRRLAFETGKAMEKEGVLEAQLQEKQEMAAEFRKTVLGLVEKGLEERGIRKKVGVLGMKYGEGGIGKVFTCLLGKGSVAVKLVKAGPSFNPSGPMEDPDLQQRLVEATSESDHLVRYHGSMRLGTSGYRRLDIMEDLPNFNPLDNGKYGVGGWGEVSRADMPDFVRRILLPVLEGVQALHRKGIVHCDLKPMNILVKPSDHQGGDPEVKVGDYDIHKTNESTEANSFGTPPFMSPEQWMVKKITTKSDIYSIGLMLYYWAGGDRPIVNDVMDYADRAISGDHELNRLDCDPGLRAIIADCLRKNPVERPSIQELMDRIGQCFPRDSEAGRGMGVEGDPQAGKEGRDVGSDAGKVAA